jgi:FAD/FMN-containing dehydrogenase
MTVLHEIHEIFRSARVAAGTRMHVLAAALAARALGLLFGWEPETAAITGWRFGRVPRGAAHLFLQLGDTSA